MKMLVVYGSKRGGTAGLAQMVGDALAEHRVEAAVQDARNADAPDAYDAVIVAGALYAHRWHRDARRFVRRHADALRQKPVWFISSGPLDRSARTGEIPAVRQVAKLMEHVGARGHMTFGGRLALDAKGFPASAMAKKQAGDWRDPDHVRAWIDGVTAELSPQPS
jgi:menaquinone-dependent protoporphyrinogen oxidase